GFLENTFLRYNREGAVAHQINYKKGLPVGTSIVYSKTSNGYYPHVIRTYNKNGELVLFQRYEGEWNKRYLSHESTYELKSGKVKITNFYENGKISDVYYWINGHYIGDYIEYDKQGNINRLR